MKNNVVSSEFMFDEPRKGQRKKSRKFSTCASLGIFLMELIQLIINSV